MQTGGGGEGGKNSIFCEHAVKMVPYLAYAEDIERGCVERPDEEVLWPERLDDDGLARPRQVGHRVVATHRVAEATQTRVHAVEIPVGDQTESIRMPCKLQLFGCNKIDLCHY